MSRNEGRGENEIVVISTIVPASPGDAAEIESLFVELSRHAEDHAGVLIYTYYRNPHDGVYRVIERFRDAQAQREHAFRGAGDAIARLAEISEFRDFEILGPVDPAVRAVMDPLGPVYRDYLSGW